MLRLRPAAAAVSVLIFSGLNGAQAEVEADWPGVASTLELRSHQALIDRMSSAGTTLAPFETDGCSGGLSDIWTMVSGQFPEFADVHEDVPPWEECCVVHDAAYHDAGGTNSAQASYAARVTADDALRMCVIRTGDTRREQIASQYGVEPHRVEQAYGLIADAMHLAVRFGGAPCSGLSWRWGYGYPDCSFLQHLDKK